MSGCLAIIWYNQHTHGSGCLPLLELVVGCLELLRFESAFGQDEQKELAYLRHFPTM